MTPAPPTRPHATVVAAFGRRVRVEDDDGVQYACRLRGKRLRPVCGDRVVLSHDDEGAIVESIAPRETVLGRPDRRGREEVLAANLTQLLVVAAAEPSPDPFITDRYLAAAAFIGAAAVIVYNKSDLERGDGPGWLASLADIGYPVLHVSAASGLGLEALRRHAQGHVSILVGQSGVGKSSLLNALVPGAEVATGAVSAGSGEGRHTTTASVMHRVPGGGRLIDSPGVRDYAPAPVEAARVDVGFREIAARAGQCRFANCLHLREPRCAVLAAVESGAIDERRYKSYRRLMNTDRTFRTAGTAAGKSAR